MKTIATKLSLLTIIAFGIGFATPSFAEPQAKAIKPHQMARHIVKTRATQLWRGTKRVLNTTIGRPLRYVVNNPGKTLGVAVPTALLTATAVSPEFREAAVHAIQAGADLVKMPIQYVGSVIKAHPVASTAIGTTLGALASGIGWGTKGYNRGLKAAKGEAAPIK
ncbi:MAG: hypothetical protein KC503_25630 [Myxococcales bacterium]|nr:hypothetical protein [Myxococcales bacterium]